MQSYSQIEHRRFSDGAAAGAWWDAAPDGNRIDCLLCPRKCRLKSGDRGFCFVRENRDGEIVLTTYGKSTGFCIDPIEKKPLNHFFPGTPVLSFGTAGCNLGCQFCQNWDISKSRETQRLSSLAEPEAIARAAAEHSCTSVAYTYNDPIIWAEYAIDTAKACRELGIKNVAVTAGYIAPEARQEFFEYMDAANVDLKAFTEEFYRKITYSHLEPILETLVYLRQETQVWFELTNLIIPNANDNPDDLRRMCNWIVSSLGEEVPVHFTAFHPDFRMMDRSRTDPATLVMAQEIAWSEGIKFAYVGNVHDPVRQNTHCPGCGHLLVERNWYQLGAYHLDAEGRCAACQTAIPGRFGPSRGNWGAKRQPIRIAPIEPTSDTPTLHRIQLSESNSKEVQVSNMSTPSSAETTANPPSAPSQPRLLDMNLLTRDQKASLAKAGAHWLASAIYGHPIGSPVEMLGGLGDAIVMGAFVTVKRGDILRGCCGVLGKPMPLGAAIASAAAKTAREDQRMAPVSASELPFLTLDVTLLGPFERIVAEGAARQEAVEIGKHGLMIQRQDRSGLLLPSVATERGWNAVQFLQAVCNKAGLPIGSWESSDATVFTFLGKSMGGELSSMLPGDLKTVKRQPVTHQQLASYANVAGQNIVAMVTGGTPSYVIPELPDVSVNAIVLSLEWSSGDGSQTEQGNLLQASFRPGMALQATLYQMCQQAAEMFRRQRFVGQLKIGLTLGFDPAMHGFGLKADLRGVEPTIRGLVISDARHCGFAFHPEVSIDEIRDKLREHLPISSRDATVHSMQVISTMPHIVSVSAPVAISAQGMRPPAVAGKFYPAEDAARRAMVGTLFKNEAPAQSSPLAIMVPHAGIKYSGKVAAKVWRSLLSPESKPMIIISPKHTANGVNWSVCPFDSWQVSQTTSIAGDPELARQIAAAVTPLELDAAAHQAEHGIEVQLPILEKLAPKCQVVGLALNGGSWDDIRAAAAEFAAFLKTLPQLPLLVISSDMNHYAPDAENRRRDRLALDAMATGDPATLLNTCRENDISMCGQVPAAFVMETLHQLGLEFRVTEVDYTTSAEVSGDKSQVVGYAGLLLQPA